MVDKGYKTENVQCSKERFQPFKASNVISTKCQVTAVFRNGPYTASEAKLQTQPKEIM